MNVDECSAYTHNCTSGTRLGRTPLTIKINTLGNAS